MSIEKLEIPPFDGILAENFIKALARSKAITGQLASGNQPFGMEV
ncbi:hypothetical protein [Geitlerinema sp. PCC 7407]|nr:hypothetical protein [Geitlerinema sp. PCC 7407]